MKTEQDAEPALSAAAFQGAVDHGSEALSQPDVPAAELVSVPLRFLRGFLHLAHNYSLSAEAPDYYMGTERDAFAMAFRRCGQDLAELKDLLGSSLRPAGSNEMSSGAGMRASADTRPKKSC